MKTLRREKQLKYTDVEEMRVITNDRRTAEQITSDLTSSVQGNLVRSSVENVTMNGSKVGNFGNFERQQNLKSVVMDGVKGGKGDKVKNVVMNGVKKMEKLENCEVDEEMWGQNEERLCKLIIKGLARRNREKTRDVGRRGRITRTRRHML